MDAFYFKKDIVSSNKAFNELEKIRLNHKPTKKVLILDQSNNPPDMMNTIRNNNAYEDNFYIISTWTCKLLKLSTKHEIM